MKIRYKQSWWKPHKQINRQPVAAAVSYRHCGYFICNAFLHIKNYRAHLVKSLVWALSPYDISGVKVICDDTIRDEVSSSFLESFTHRWNEVLDMIEEEFNLLSTSQMLLMRISMKN